MRGRSVPGIEIVTVDDLPEGASLVAEFGPGFIHLAVRSGLSQAETLAAVADAWQAIRDHYGEDRLRLMEAAS